MTDTGDLFWSAKQLQNLDTVMTRTKSPTGSVISETLLRQFQSAPRILIIGCGGAGNNCINRVQRMGLTGATTVAVNTDKQHLDLIEADIKLLIGRSITYGLGAGGYPEVGARCARAAEQPFRELLEGSDLVFIAAGMGGGTGTGSAPVIAEYAKHAGAIVIGVATMPFRVERARCRKAAAGMEKFEQVANSVIRLDNNRLLRIYPHLPINEAFETMDTIVAEIVTGITETLLKPSLINIDFADIKTIMSIDGLSTMLYCKTETIEPLTIIESTLDHPLLDIELRGGRGALIHITGGPDLTLEAVQQIAKGLTAELSSDANIIIGARIDTNNYGHVKVMSIITGVLKRNLNTPLQKAKIASDGKYPNLGSRQEVSTPPSSLIGMPTMHQEITSQAHEQQQQRSQLAHSLEEEEQ